MGRRASEVGVAILTTARGVRWYVRELMGDSRYERYVRHVRSQHPDAAVPSERQFWRERHAREDRNPTSRCC